MKVLLGMTAVAVLALGTPGVSHAIEVDAPGMRVDVGEGGHWRHRDDHGWHRGWDRGWHGGWHRGWHAYGRGCETVTVRKRIGGEVVVRRIRRCH
jgi:hypothetical protein